MVSDHGAYTLRTSARLNQTLRRPNSTHATSAAVSTRRMARPSSTRSLRQRQLVRRPSALRSDRDQPIGGRHGSASWLSCHALGKHVGCGNRTGDLREPHPPRLHQRLGRHPGQAGPVPAPRSPSHRTTDRSACRNTIRSMPSSVAFWTSHSGRSCLGTATASRGQDVVARDDDHVTDRAQGRRWRCGRCATVRGRRSP